MEIKTKVQIMISVLVVACVLITVVSFANTKFIDFGTYEISEIKLPVRYSFAEYNACVGK